MAKVVATRPDGCVGFGDLHLCGEDIAVGFDDERVVGRGRTGGSEYHAIGLAECG